MSYQPEWHLPKDHQLPSNGGEPPVEAMSAEETIAAKEMLRHIIKADFAEDQRLGTAIPDDMVARVIQWRVELKQQLVWDLGFLIDLRGTLEKEKGPVYDQFYQKTEFAITKILQTLHMPVYKTDETGKLQCVGYELPK